MPSAIKLRTDFTAGELRRLAKKAKDVNQSRRLLSLAAVLNGMSRTEAAIIGAMDRQTLRDWVHLWLLKTPKRAEILEISVKMKERPVNVKKPSLALKETAGEQPANNGTTRPKNPSANVLPTDGFVLEIDGKFKSEYDTSEAAMKAGLDLKKKFPFIQVVMYGAKERTRTLVALAE